jgi:hypothetical protein
VGRGPRTRCGGGGRLPRAAWILALLALSGVPGAATAELRVAERYPRRGQEVLVTLEGDLAGRDFLLRVTYRPNAQTASQEELPARGGELRWVPRDAGIVELQALALDAAEAPAMATARVAVRYGGFPASGLLVMSIAGLLLFGGATLAFWLLTRGTPPGGPTASDLPST